MPALDIKIEKPVPAGEEPAGAEPADDYDTADSAAQDLYDLMKAPTADVKAIRAAVGRICAAYDADKDGM